jgi:hypothetical protein
LLAAEASGPVKGIIIFASSIRNLQLLLHEVDAKRELRRGIKIPLIVFGTLVAQLKKYCKAAKAQHTPAMRVILFVWTEQAQHTVYEYLKELFNEETVLKLEFAVVAMGHTLNERGEEMAEQSE